MSLIGTLEQLNLSSVLRRLETHAKTGALIVGQGVQVELYFREGRLICIGPLRTNAPLEDRLALDGVISQQTLREAKLLIGDEQATEMCAALTLMDSGLAGRDVLRTWTVRKAVEVLQVILAWSHGEIYFEEEMPPPADRLLVGLSVTSLLDSLPVTAVLPTLTAPPAVESVAVVTPEPEATPLARARLYTIQQELPNAARETGDLIIDDIASQPTLFTPAQFVPEASRATSAVISRNSVKLESISSLVAQDTPPAGLGPAFSASLSSLRSISQPIPVTRAETLKRVDISFMRPDMMLTPLELTESRGQDCFITITPEQWRLLTLVNGHTTLQNACQELGMMPEAVCQLAGELLTENVIGLSYPGSEQTNVPATVSRESLAAGSEAMPTAAVAVTASTVSPQRSEAVLPSAAFVQFSPTQHVETQSQWGNGGNGATFVPGRGWITSSMPAQRLQRSGSYATIAERR